MRSLALITMLCCTLLLHADTASAQSPEPLPLNTTRAALALTTHPLSSLPMHLLDGPLLLIPALEVAIPITTFPLDGVSWAIDPWEVRVGHLQGTAWTDTQPGNIALGGHAEYPNGTPGIFHQLATLAPGDTIMLIDAGQLWHYDVVTATSVPFDDLSVVYPTETAQLTLITCDIPTYNTSTGLYDERLVIIAQSQ